MLIKQIVDVWTEEGFGSLVYRIRKKIKKDFHKFLTRLASKLKDETDKDSPTRVRNFLNQTKSQSNPQTHPFSFLKVEGIELRLNLVTDSIKKTNLFGGLATSLILATLFANKQNIPLRIISRTTESSPKDYDDFLSLMNLERPKKVEFFSDYKTNIRLEVSDQDIFLSTSWWSSKTIKEINQRSSFFYLLQEVELFFYPHGDDHWQCSRILEDNSIHYLINTKILHDFYQKNSFENVISRCSFFEPAFPEHLFKALESAWKPKDKQTLFFYSRPNNSRNLFKTGLEILDEAILRGIINEKEWDIYFAGVDIPEITFSTGLKPKILNQMSFQNYSEFSKTVDLCFSLMYTPHPSYPPLDIAASGGVVLTNKYPGKESLPYSNNIICENLELESMLEGFQKAIALTHNYEDRKKNYLNHRIERDWKNSLDQTLQYMADHI